MYIGLGGLFNICEKGGGGSMHPLKNYGGFCVITLNAFNLHNYMADSAIILYLECLKGLVDHFKKLGQCALNKKNYIKICKKHILNF